MKKLFSTKKAQAGAVGTMIFLIVGVGVSVLTLILVGVMGGQIFQVSESKIDNISNDTVRNNIRDSIIAGFDAQKQTGEFLPIIVLGVITALVLSLVLSFLPLVGGTGGFGGTAL